MKGWQLKTGMYVRHDDERKYVKTLSHTMGNVIHVVLRREGGELESVQFLTEQDVEVLQ